METITSALSEFDDYIIKFIPRICNGAADWVATNSCKGQWIGFQNFL